MNIINGRLPARVRGLVEEWAELHQDEFVYALRESNKPIGVAIYRILGELPAELQGSLPSPEQICRLLEGL